jgi:uncharacterized protein (TIGR02453 family)
VQADGDNVLNRYGGGQKEWRTAMAVKAVFEGFPRACVRFYEDLARNNTREWFSEHKSEFEDHVMTPARDFVYEMGERIREIAPKIVADPRLDRSIFRHYRDTRFSRDKAPYKTHLGIFLWEGQRPKMECPGYYFHLEPPNLLLGVGIHCFSKPLLECYRDSVVHPEHGADLGQAVKAVEDKGYAIGVRHFKKTPRGYDPHHDNATLLLHNGLTAAFMARIPDELYTTDLIPYCFRRFADMAPIHRWLLDMIGRL